MAAEVASIAEVIEWAEYMIFLWKEIVRNKENMDIVVYTDFKSWEVALKYARSVKNRI